VGSSFCIAPMPTVALHTLGCKLNHAETSTIARQFLKRGFEVVDFGLPADVTLINTCSVTARADRECRQLIRRSLRVSPRSSVLVTGCYAQLRPEEVASIEGVRAVLGSQEKFRIFDLIDPSDTTAGPAVHVSEIGETDDFGPAYSSAENGRTRAFFKVQDGCDYNCSFCTIPLARGASRSQAIDACVAQAGELVAQGYREIVLTGVNVGDYGRKDGNSLLELLRALESVPGLERLRISSIEPNLLTDEIINLVAASETICNHFHIPLQSGDDDILRRMRRRYRTDQYAVRIDRIRNVMPECGIGVDVIAGFPGESERHFANTCAFLDAIDVTYLHVFTYSERPGTPASADADQVRPEERFRRNRVLTTLGRRKKERFLQRVIGSRRMVLFESETENGMRFGLTEEYIRVGVPEEGTAENLLAPVDLLRCGGDRCFGAIPDGVTA